MANQILCNYDTLFCNMIFQKGHHGSQIARSSTSGVIVPASNRSPRTAMKFPPVYRALKPQHNVSPDAHNPNSTPQFTIPAQPSQPPQSSYPVTPPPGSLEARPSPPMTTLSLNTMHIHAYNFALLVRLVLLIIGLVLLFENPRIVVYYIIPAAAALCALPKAWMWWKRQAGVVSYRTLLKSFLPGFMMSWLRLY